jgi:UDP-N-acetylmuramate--alanine ligase
MKALAELLSDAGWTLTGSDLQFAPNRPRKNDGRLRRVHQGHTAANVSEAVDVLIFSPAIRDTNPERQAARERGIAELSYVDALSQLMSERTGIAIAGTHGKTTTTAMVAAILRESGQNPSALIGGEVIQYERSGWAGSGDLLVVEACEYRRHFLSVRPRIAAILNIEPDHFDCFATIDESRKAFEEFAHRVNPNGALLLRSDVAKALRDRLPARLAIETYSIRDSADWLVRDLDLRPGISHFEVCHNGKYFCDAALSVPGRHNVENALAAIALAHAVGTDAAAIASALSLFRGVRRRFEFIAERDGVTLIDDYAHHPTAIRATLAAVRQTYPDRRILVVFQPHQVSRTEALLDDFATSFGDADQVLLVPVFAARESQSDAAACLKKLGRAVQATGQTVRLLESLDHVLATMQDSASPGDICLTLGAGDIDRIPHEFARHVS